MVFGCLCDFQFPTIAQAIFVTLMNKIMPFLINIVKGALGFDKKPSVQKEDWKEDVVYLYQFPRSPQCPSISPYCLKVETFLRLHKIPYENVYTLKARSEQGLLPFIELNGRQIADSAHILNKLKKIHDIKDYDNARDEAHGRALSLAVEKHSFAVLAKYKVLDNTTAFLRVAMNMAGLVEWAIPLLTPIGSFFVRRKITGKLHSAIGNFPDAVYDDLLNKDLQMIENSLQDGKNFLFGGGITEADLVVFCMLASVICLPLNSLPERLIKEKYTKIGKYMDRVKSATWGDEFEQK